MTSGDVFFAQMVRPYLSGSVFFVQEILVLKCKEIEVDDNSPK